MPRPHNVYDLLSREQIVALLDLTHNGIDELRFNLKENNHGYSIEEIEIAERSVELAQEAYELIAADSFPEHARPEVLAQLNPLVEGYSSPTAIPADEREDAARHLLSVLREDGGVRPGSFITHVLEAFFTADAGNFTILGQSFPSYGAALDVYRQGGVAGLRLWAGIS